MFQKRLKQPFRNILENRFFGLSEMFESNWQVLKAKRCDSKNIGVQRTKIGVSQNSISSLDSNWLQNDVKIEVKVDSKIVINLCFTRKNALFLQIERSSIKIFLIRKCMRLSFRFFLLLIYLMPHERGPLVNRSLLSVF